MIQESLRQFSSWVNSLQLSLLVINIILHIIFASAVAKDAGKMDKLGEKTMLVSGMTWSFATLLGGVFVAAIYWVIHHSKITRN